MLARFTDNSAAVLIWDDAIALAGDFNADGVVDASDYTVWRDRLGSAFAAADYDAWRTHFGQSIGSGSGSVIASVPEPMGRWPLALSTALAVAALRRIRCDNV